MSEETAIGDGLDLGLTLEAPGAAGLRFRDVLRNGLGEPAAKADPRRGLAPRWVVPDPSTPGFPFTLNDRDEVWADDLDTLYEKGNAHQWDATRDIPWDQLKRLPQPVEQATARLMTFLAENEMVALYLPAKFLPRISPEYIEVALVLAAQVKDEARHLEVFSKRALAGGAGPQTTSANTQWALKSLFEQEDFSEASFLLHILGEGTFMELLAFIQEHAHDEVSREILVRARQDEARHVAYGVQHAAYRIRHDPEAADRFLKAAESRASFVRATAGVNADVQHALAVLAGGGDSPSALAEGRRAVRELHADMHEKRMLRMDKAGFPHEVAEKVSALHGGGVKTFM